MVDIKGDVTSGSEDVLMSAYDAAGDARAIVLNFSDLAYMNSGASACWSPCWCAPTGSRQRLMAFGLSDHYRQIFELTRLDEAVGIHDSEQAALGAAGAT